MQNLQYRPYQEECLDAIESAGAGKHLIALATGLGKTVIFTGIPNRGRTLILSHRDELVPQPDVSQKHLADMLQLKGLDLDKNAIQRIESGKRFVTDIELRYFAKVLNVSYEALLDPDVPENE